MKCKRFNSVIFLPWIFLIVLMYARCFWGTEITDEAFYLADAKAMLEGNLPLAYCNYSLASCAAFLIIPQIFVYGLFFPSLQGVVLFMRLSFTTFRIAILMYTFLCLKKYYKKENVILAIGIMIPWWVGFIQQYSYNSISSYLAFGCAIALYDINFQNNNKLRLFIIGFVMGICVLAHIGYGIAAFIFAILIIINSQKNDKFANFIIYCMGGVVEVAIVVCAVAAQVGWLALWDGIMKYINPFIRESMSETTALIRIYQVIQFGKPIIYIGTIAFIIILYLNLVNKTKRKYIGYVYSISFVISILLSIINRSSDRMVYSLGITTIIFSIIYFIFCDEVNKRDIFVFIGIYPIIFCLLEILFAGSNAAIARLVFVVPSFVVIMLKELEMQKGLVHYILMLGCICGTVIITFADGTYVYRDSSILELNTKVKKGVYAGLLTTEERANDLPELEKYLNEIIDESDRYAFRDNVPAGYLMVNGGEMCDLATWDCLQYSYNLNTPSILFDYYRRRNAIPDKIIYIDYGRDENLSVEDENYRYNDFVNLYYSKVIDKNLNSTFKRIMVYEYKENFDNNYRYWIDKYNYIP